MNTETREYIRRERDRRRRKILPHLVAIERRKLDYGKLGDVLELPGDTPQRTCANPRCARLIIGGPANKIYCCRSCKDYIVKLRNRKAKQ